jgi:putative heme-binding domain-containing protein
VSERAGGTERRSGLKAALRSAAVASLQDTDAHVQRAAADALGANPSPENIPPLIALLDRVRGTDTHLRHVTRMALRDCLALAKDFAGLATDEYSSRALADIAPAITNAAAGSFLVAHLQKYSEPRDKTAAYLKHAARFVPEKDLDSLASFTRRKFGEDVDLQLALFKSVQDGTAQRGAKLSQGARDWGAELAAKLLAPDLAEAAWINPQPPVDGLAFRRNLSPWALQERSCADGQKAQLMSSFPHGEPLTGTLRSQPFALPARLSFYLAGHDGFPDKPAQKKNVVRLRDAVTDVVLREAWPPRNDTAQRIVWDLSEFSGKRGCVEATDGDTGSAYAWLAFGRFDPALPQLALGSDVSARLQAAADIARSLQLASLEPDLTTLLLKGTADTEARAASARALAAFYPAGTAKDSSAAVNTLARVLNNSAEPVALREKVAVALGEVVSPAAGPTLVSAMKAAPSRLQARLAAALASTGPGAEALLQAIAEGKASPRLLQERAVKDRLSATKPADLDARVLQLTKGLAPANEALQKLIDQRSKGYIPAKASAAKGVDLFTKNCAVCHQIEGKGALIGPQLDGIGNRGLERLCEDVLDPNRAVDLAFRSTLLTMKDGDVMSGLFRREEGEMVVLAESTGKEISVPKKQIAERRESETSLMPENFGELLAPGDFNDLMAFLLSQAGRPAGP